MRRLIALSLFTLLALHGWAGDGFLSRATSSLMCGRCGREPSFCECPSTNNCDRRITSDIPCDVPPRKGPPPPEEDKPPTDSVTRETGFYQAPPATGSFQGPTRSFGIAGGAIVLPEMRLRLPSIELPCFHRVREGARMRVHAAEAPWVSTGFETVRVGPATPIAPDGPRSAPLDDSPRQTKDESCDGLKQEYQRKIEELNRKLQDCEEMKKCIEQCLEKYPHVSVDGNSPSLDESDDQVPTSHSTQENNFPMRRAPQPPALDDVSHYLSERPQQAAFSTTTQRLPSTSGMRRLPPVSTPNHEVPRLLPHVAR
jgi:hypothetical protein